MTKSIFTLIMKPLLWLTKPSAILTKSNDIRKARLLASLLLPLFLFFIIGFLATPQDEKLVLAAGAVGALLLYLLSRTRFYSVAAVLSVMALSIFMFFAMQEAGEYTRDRLVSEMKFMSIPLLLGSLCLSFRFMLPFNLLVIGLLTQAKRLYDINPDIDSAEGIIFVSIIAALGLVASAILNRQQQEIDRERKKADELLLNILPGSIAHELKEQGQVKPQDFPTASILFADIVGFTSYSAEVDALNLVDLLNDIFSRIDRVVERYNLEKIKTMGDCYMIAGGVPIPREGHLQDMASAALDIQSLILDVCSEYQVDLNMRIGMDEGRVVASVVGTQKFIYDVWGDAVNMASRMESTGIPGQIQITRRVAQQLHPHFTISKRGLISVKGRGEVMTYILEKG